jgi:hypothetical protein
MDKGEIFDAILNLMLEELQTLPAERIPGAVVAAQSIEGLSSEERLEILDGGMEVLVDAEDYSEALLVPILEAMLDVHERMEEPRLARETRKWVADIKQGIPQAERFTVDSQPLSNW